MEEKSKKNGILSMDPAWVPYIVVVIAAAMQVVALWAVS